TVSPLVLAFTAPAPVVIDFSGSYGFWIGFRADKPVMPFGCPTPGLFDGSGMAVNLSSFRTSRNEVTDTSTRSGFSGKAATMSPVARATWVHGFGVTRPRR